MILLLSFACDKSDVNVQNEFNNTNLSSWDINTDYIIGELNNNFPLVSKPVFINVREEDKLNLDDKVFAVKYNNTVKVFPVVNIYSIEIVNDVIDDLQYMVSLCPKTMSALSWNRINGHDTAEYRASGMLYKSNLLPLDTKTGDIWSQMLSICVKGKNAGIIPQRVTLIETNWNTITSYYPEAMVFQLYEDATVSGGNYEKNEPIIDEEDEDNSDNTNIDFNIPKGDRIFGIPGLNKLKIFTNNFFNDSTHLYTEQSYIIVGNNSIDYVHAFYRKNGLNFYAVQNELPVIMADNQGNKWDLFGYAVEGPLKGEKLNSPTSFKAYWWAWNDFFSTIELFGN